MSASFKSLEAAASRREFLKVSVAAGGGLLLGFALPRGHTAEHAEPAVAPFAPDAFIRIDRTGVVTLTMCQVEMGQGIYTSISQILADELDVDFGHVVVEAAPPNDALYTNAALGFQVTGGSTSIRVFWMPMRKAGASARAMLVEAAAATWRVDPATCRTSNSEVIHEPSGRRLPYGALIDRAAHLTPPEKPTLKARKEFQLIGTPARRLDSPDKVNGRAKFGIDAMPPGVKFATLRASPVFGGKLAHVDEAGARDIPGVRQVVVLDDLVAVVGDHMWTAKKGLEALQIKWDDGQNAGVSSEQIFDQIRAASERDGVVAKSVGDISMALGSNKIEATYH